MSILVLSRNAALYSTNRLVRAGQALDYEVSVVDPLALQLTLPNRRTASCLAYAGRPLGAFDLVVPRFGSSITRYGNAVLDLVQTKASLNGPSGIALARDKWRSLVALKAAGVHVPKSICVRSPKGVLEAAAALGPYPLVIKLQAGTHGVGTMIAESERALSSLVETFCAMGRDVIVQQGIHAHWGRDVRAFVIGQKVFAAMRREAGGDEFRANLHRGGRGTSVNLSGPQKETAVRAAQAIGLEVAGIDLLTTRGKATVIDVNATPGLEGIEQATGVDVATAVIKHGLALGKPNQAKARTRG